MPETCKHFYPVRLNKCPTRVKRGAIWPRLKLSHLDCIIISASGQSLLRMTYPGSSISASVTFKTSHPSTARQGEYKYSIWLELSPSGSLHRAYISLLAPLSQKHWIKGYGTHQTRSHKRDTRPQPQFQNGEWSPRAPSGMDIPCSTQRNSTSGTGNGPSGNTQVRSRQFPDDSSSLPAWPQ